ncbi:DUF3196 family protein [Williamsoniiplasma luminosum]
MIIFFRKEFVTMFYEELKQELELLKQQKDFSAALKLIEQELQMPYVPHEFEQYLINLKQEITSEMMSEQTRNQKQYDVKELIKMLNDEQDLASQALAIKALEHINVRPILTEIEHYLMNAIMPDENKTLILFILNAQQINQSVKMQKTNGFYTLNPMELQINQFNQNFDQVVLMIENAIGNENPSISQIACSSALIFMLINFPAPNQIAANNLAAAMIKQAHEFLGLELNYPELKTMINFDQAMVEIILGGTNEQN